MKEKSCFTCDYGSYWDMSVDDLTVKCYINGVQMDYCNFNMKDDFIPFCSLDDANKITLLKAKILKYLYDEINKRFYKYFCNDIDFKANVKNRILYIYYYCVYRAFDLSIKVLDKNRKF